MQVNRLIWDDWNVAHIARHGVTPDEVEQVCQNEPVILSGYGGRLVFVGVTNADRLLAAVLDPSDIEGVFYPVTARPAARKERQMYANVKAGGGLDD